MKCPKCEFDNPEGMQFCGKCGTQMKGTCPKCDFANPPDFEYCGKCGHSLTEAPAIDYSEPQSYTPRFLADKILTSKGAIEGERKLVTVLFADVANYTSISEKLDPEDVHRIMDGCLKLMMDEIHRYEGTVDKFTGDGIMALFGAPVAHEDHAQRACYAALAIQEAMQGYSDKVQSEHGVEFKVRVGLDSGSVIVDSVGNDLKMDYTAIGDPVNLASRMESTADPGSVLVSSDTYRLTREFFKFEPLGKVSVKGKEEPVEAYKLMEAEAVQTRLEAAIRRGLTRFVGREREMATLREALEKVQSGSGQVVGIVGEAGVGKSRMLLELREQLPTDSYKYLEGRCLHFGGSMPYLPLLDIMRAYFGIEEGEQESVIKGRMDERIDQLDKELRHILPPLQDILSLKVEDEEYLKLEPQQRRERVFESIRDFLIRESQERPLVIAVEDLHWIDRTSEEFLNYLIGSLANARILLVILYRPEYNHQWGSKSFYTQISVGQLSTGSSADLLQAILGEGEIVPELRELILSRTSGNPLFVEEFTQTLLANGSIAHKDNQYMLSVKASDIQVPDTIQGIIAARMDRLEDNLKRTMQVASVIGRDFAYRILKTITGMREELKSYMLDLQGLEFIYEKNLFPELEYIFKHALTQEVVYNSVLLKRRKEIHSRIGEAIEQLYADRLEEFYEMLAHHYSRSENLEKAYQYLKLSGEKADRSYSLWETHRFYKEAATLIDQLPESVENKRKGIEIRLLIRNPMRLLGFPGDSLEILQEGERLSQELGDDRSVAAFYGTLGFYWATMRGDPVQGIRYQEKCIDAAERAEDIESMATIGVELCSAYALSGEYFKVCSLAPRIVAMLEKTGSERESFSTNVNPYSMILSTYGNSMVWMGNHKEGEALCQKALEFAQKLDNPYTTSFVRWVAGWNYNAKGDATRAVPLLEQVAQLSEQSQFLLMTGMAYSALGWGYHLAGKLDNAREAAEKGIKFQGDLGIPFYMSIAYACVGMVYFDRGELENAQLSAEKAVESARSCNERMWEAYSMMLLGRILSKRDVLHHQDAIDHILRGIKRTDDLKLKLWSCRGYLYLGEAYFDTGQPEKALEALKKAEAEFKDMGMDYYLRKTQEVLQRIQG
jgi:class 3 adenylate cyclase/tetratricopeptide (TPR) repeat protein